MARLGRLLAGAGLLLSGAGKTDAFYLPGKAPASYADGEKVSLASLLFSAETTATTRTLRANLFPLSKRRV